MNRLHEGNPLAVTIAKQRDEIKRLRKVVDAAFVWADAEDTHCGDTNKAVAQLDKAVREYRSVTSVGSTTE